MVDDNPDLTLPAETPEEGSEVKELASDFQTFGEWRKKVLEEELERENEKVKKMAKGGSSRVWKNASWCPCRNWCLGELLNAECLCSEISMREVLGASFFPFS